MRPVPARQKGCSQQSTFSIPFVRRKRSAKRELTFLALRSRVTTPGRESVDGQVQGGERQRGDDAPLCLDKTIIVAESIFPSWIGYAPGTITMPRFFPRLLYMKFLVCLL